MIQIQIPTYRSNRQLTLTVEAFLTSLQLHLKAMKAMQAILILYHPNFSLSFFCRSSLGPRPMLTKVFKTKNLHNKHLPRGILDIQYCPHDYQCVWTIRRLNSNMVSNWDFKLCAPHKSGDYYPVIILNWAILLTYFTLFVFKQWLNWTS